MSGTVFVTGASAVHWGASLPPHVNFNVIEMMPVAQSSGPLQVHRG